jgi:signal transduction histidine kinase
LQSHDRIYGSLWLLYSRRYTPSPYDVQLAEILAAQAAVALENSELMVDNAEHQQILEDKVAERTMELAVALDKAEDADRLKTQLLSTVSHELRTPLAVIKAHLSTLINYYDRLPKERHVQYLNIAHGETDRLTSMINGLLDMSRLDAGRLDIRPTPIEPVQLLTRFIDLFQTRYPDRLFTLAMPPELNQALGDSERVWQVLSNLVDNAAKYSPPGKPIEIGAQAWEDSLELWVKDSGDGLTPEQIRRVFDRFFQVENLNRVGTRSGVGLGLAICKGLIEEMGGRIWCESRGLGLGSKFAFTLPWFKEQ